MAARRSIANQSTVSVAGARVNSARRVKGSKDGNSGRGVDCDGVPKKWTKTSDPISAYILKAALDGEDVDKAWGMHDDELCACPPASEDEDEHED